MNIVGTKILRDCTERVNVNRAHILLFVLNNIYIYLQTIIILPFAYDIYETDSFITRQQPSVYTGPHQCAAAPVTDTQPALYTPNKH